MKIVHLETVKLNKRTLVRPAGPKHRYELWSWDGYLATYKTLGQALLGAAWRSRKRKQSIIIYRCSNTTTDKRVAVVEGF